MKIARLFATSLLAIGLAACPKSETEETKTPDRPPLNAPSIEDAHHVLETTLDLKAAADRARSVLAANPGDPRAEALLGALRAWTDERLYLFGDLRPELVSPPEAERVRAPGRAFVFHPAAPFEESSKPNVPSVTRLLPMGLPVRVLDLEGDKAKIELEAWMPPSADPSRPMHWMLGDWAALEDPTERIVLGLLGRPVTAGERTPFKIAARTGLLPLSALITTTVTASRLAREAERTTGSSEERAVRLARYTALEPRDRGKQRELLRVALEAGLYSLAVLAADDLRVLSDTDQPFEWSMVIDHHAYCRGKAERSYTEWFDRVPELRPFPSTVYEVKRTSELAGRYLTETRFDAALPSHGTEKNLCLVDSVLTLGAGDVLRIVGDRSHQTRCEVPEVDREAVLDCVETQLSRVDEDTSPEILAQTRERVAAARRGEGELSFLSWKWALREFPPDEVQDIEAVLECLPGPRAETRDLKGPSGLVDGDTLEGRTRRWLEETRRRFPQKDLLRISITNRRAIPASPGRESLVYRFAGSTCECEAAPTGVEFRKLPPFVVPPRGELDLLVRVPRPVGAGVELAGTFEQAVQAVEALALPEGGSNDEPTVRACLAYDRGCERPLPEATFARRFAAQAACCCR